MKHQYSKPELSQYSSLPKNKPEQETMRIDLKVKLPNTQLEIQPTISKNKLTHSKSKEQELQSIQLQLSDRTRGVNQFLLTNKESPLPLTKYGNIKSYLRIKPNKSSFMPFGIYNNQTIVYDRSVYKFDYIFQQQTQQSKVYQIVCKEVTNKFIQGYNGTIFAYGSTGSGKTYTMFGNDDGLVPSVVNQIFSKLQPNDKLSCSMIEIYRENLIDLLSENDVELKIKQINNVCTIPNLCVHSVSSQQDTLQLIKKGNHLKKIRETDLNQSSSRSHIVFTFHLDKIDAKGRAIKAKFNLVDLAGSQKVCKSKVQGEGLEQAKKINLSLSCLGNTISALVKNSEHIPYRQSKLTRILKQSLMGNSITRLVVTCSITQQSIEQTISSIKFAQRAQKVQTQSQVAYNISKFKGDKEQKQKMIRVAFQKAEQKLRQISQLVCQQQSVCQKCKQIKKIITNKETQLQDIFNFNPLNTYLSPKSSINIRSFFTNPSERMSSVSKRPVSKYRDVAMPNRDLQSQMRDVCNKKTFEIKVENNKLKEQKTVLQQKIKKLQQKCIGLQKTTKLQRPSKKIIKLGNVEGKATKANKQNLPNLSNVYTDNNGKKSTKECTFKTEELQSNKSWDILNYCKQSSKAQELQSAVSMMKEFIAKLQNASQEYKENIIPLELNVMQKQVILLEKKLQNESNESLQMTPFIKQVILLHKELKKSVSNYYFSFCLSLDRLFQISQYEFKEQIMTSLQQKQKEIQGLIYKCKDLDESDELAVLNSLLQKSKMLGLVKQKQQKQKAESKRILADRELGQSYNEFLDVRHSERIECNL